MNMILGLDIGGHTSRWIHLDNRSASDGEAEIIDFSLNERCAAGTGSFLEEQASHLGIRVEEEFSAEASRFQSPRDLGSQCTVFMDTELVNSLSQGVSLPDIAAGLAYSIARNYLEKVVADRSIGENIVFQGGVASNPAVVKSFSILLNKPVRVHPHNRISGAIGSAILAKNAVENLEKASSRTSRLKKRINQPYTVNSFQLQWLLQQNTDYIFIPSLVDSQPERKENHYLCPYCEHLPYMLRSSFDAKILTTCINFEGEFEDFIQSMSGISECLGRKPADIKNAYFYALSVQQEFTQRLKKKGQAILEKAERESANVWVILGKPYNVYDGFLNLNLIQHLQKMGVVALPMECVPEDRQVSEECFRFPPWRYNRQIIRTTLWCRGRKNVFPIYISNFGCGPDAFTVKHLSKILEDKPHLFLEFDEHRGEAGLITRLEAFMDEIKETASESQSPEVPVGRRNKREERKVSEYRNRRFVIPSKILGSSGLKPLWQGLVAVDLMVKAACELRPYEVHKGQTDSVHKINLLDIEQGLAAGTFHKSWERCIERINGIQVRKEWRPIIGIAGDIYTRQHPEANHGLFFKLEAMGCEVWPPPLFVDDVNYGLRKSIADKFKKRKYFESAAAGLLNLRKDIETWKIKHKLKRVLDPLSEPGYKTVRQLAFPYINPENNRVLLLNIAKMVDFARRGADGVINVICLNCMLGTVSEAISAQIKRDNGRIPIPTLVYSGSDISEEDTKLEAFVYQVQKFAKRKKKQKIVEV